jgi:hypothetical protein
MGVLLSWAVRALAGSLGFLGGEEIVRWLHDLVSSFWGFVKLLGINSSPAFVEDAAKKLNELTVALNPTAMGLAADTLTQITGVGTSGAWVGFIAGKAPDRLGAVTIGAEFFPVVTNMFDVLSSATDAGSRAPGSAWRNNLNAFFGTNLLFQMRSLTISTISRMTGLDSLRHLEGLHQTINWAFGFGWLSWAVMSNYMDITINNDMKKALNAQVLGTDMTLSQGIDAAVKGYLTVNDENELLSNYGLKLGDRDIVKSLSMRLLTIQEAVSGFLMGQFDRGALDTHLQRQSFDRAQTDILLYQRQNTAPAGQAAHAFVQGRLNDAQYEEMVNRLTMTPEAKALEKALAEKDIPENDLLTMFQEGQIDEGYLTQAYRWRSFGEERTAKEVALLKDTRRLKLRDEWINVQRQLYRDCVTEEVDLRQALGGEHYTAQEIDWVVKVELAKRQIRTFMPPADMFKACADGLMDVNDAITSLQCRGFTYADAVTEASLRLKPHLPACDDVKLQSKALIAILQAAGAAAGVNGKLLKGQLLKYLQCLNAEFLLIPPVVEIDAVPKSLPAPGNVTLKWKVTLATSAKLEPIVGAVPLEGQTTVHITHSTGFTIHGHSPIGDSTGFVFVDVQPKA